MILHDSIILHGVTIPFFPCATSCQYCTEKLFLGYCLRMSQLGHRLFCPAHIFLISLRHHSGKLSAKNTNQIREWSADNTISPQHRGNFLHVLHLVSRGRSNSLGILSSRWKVKLRAPGSMLDWLMIDLGKTGSIDCLMLKIGRQVLSGFYHSDERGNSMHLLGIWVLNWISRFLIGFDWFDSTGSLFDWVWLIWFGWTDQPFDVLNWIWLDWIDVWLGLTDLTWLDQQINRLM